MSTPNGMLPMRRKEFAIFALVFVAILVVAAWVYDAGTKARFDTLETIRSGVPYASLLSRGFSPKGEGHISYQGRPATYAYFGSSSGWGELAGPRGIDFGVIVNEEGIVEVAFRISNDEESEAWELLTAGPAFEMGIEQVVVDEESFKIVSDWLAQSGVSHKFIYSNGNRLILERPLTDVELLGFLNKARDFNILISNEVIEVSADP